MSMPQPLGGFRQAEPRGASAHPGLVLDDAAERRKRQPTQPQGPDVSLLTDAVPVAAVRGNRPARDASREMVCHAATVGVAQPAIVRMDDEARHLERTARV